MLWKQPYTTVSYRNVNCPVAQVTTLDGAPPNHDCQVWIGGFGFDAISDQGVWWRLFASDFPDDKNVQKVFIFEHVTAEETQIALALVPKSEARQCFLIEDPNGLWRDLITPQRGFAAIINGSNIELLMVGPPTEDAWEEFSNCWRVRT